MTNTLEKIIDKLKAYPNIKYETSDNALTVYPNNYNGFKVMIVVHSDNHFTVYYDFWHEEFDNEEKALNCFVLGLTRECRLKVVKSGDKIYKWTLEYLSDDNWYEDSTTGTLILTFWKSRKTEYLQNDLIELKK